MKKILTASLIVIFAFVTIFVINNIDNKKQSEENSSFNSTDNQIQVNYHESSEPVGFEKIGKDFNVLLEINDYNINNTTNRNFITTDTSEHHFCRQYYLEYPYLTRLTVKSNWVMSKEMWDFSKEVYTINENTDNMIPFEFYDNFTLIINPGIEEERIIVEDVIFVSDICSIFKAKIDKYGYSDDINDIYFFATKFETLTELENEECGDLAYDYWGTYIGLEERIIYF